MTTKLLPIVALSLSFIQAQPVPQPASNATCFARYIPERKDDLAWENDRIAFRIFGPALERDVKEHHSSGIDIWAKRSPTPIINAWYSQNDYHKDHGTGLDMYDVGMSRGCGGIGIWQDGLLHISEDYVTHKILDLGPDAAGFTVTYAPWQVRTGNSSRKVWQSSTFTLVKGSNLTKIQTTLESDTKDELIVGIGIAKRPFVAGPKSAATRPGSTGRLLVDSAAGLMSYWQPDQKPGTIGCGVVVDPAQLSGYGGDDENHLLFIKVTPGKPFTYYAGATWSKAVEGSPTTAADWETYLLNFKRN